MSFLDESVRQAQTAVEQKFLFRKLGLPFDYASPPEEFPAKTFATAKEARGNIPNPQGLGSGFFYSCRNHALLFDAYLLRIELGIEAGSDEQIFDRLIGGLIRIATVAPKSFLVGGLAPDGHGFYSWTGWENHVAWAFAVTRGLKTAAIAPESQEKFHSIAGKWMDRLRRDKFILTGIDAKALPDGDLTVADKKIGPAYLAILLTAALASGDEKDLETYETAAEVESRLRLQAGNGDFQADDMPELLWRQAAYSIIAEYDVNSERAALARDRLRENAAAAERHVASWRNWDPALADIVIDWDWRKCPKADPAVSNGYGFVAPESWRRLENEKILENALDAMCVMHLAGDPGLIEYSVPEMEECLAATPWDKLATLNALAPAIVVHARGVDKDLWDRELFEARRDFQFAEESLAGKYLEPDYDKDHPDQAGHAAAPPGKQQQAPAGKGDGKRRRRRRRR